MHWMNLEHHAFSTRKNSQPLYFVPFHVPQVRCAASFGRPVSVDRHRVASH
jgi:hypothetical protein